MQAQEALKTIDLSLGKPKPGVDEQLVILNDAGEWFWGSRAWNFAIRMAMIDVRAQISFASLGWTAATKTITGGSFAAYDFLAGDQLEITAGGTRGYYEVLSKTSSTLVLDKPISSVDLVATVGGTLHLWGCALPADIESIIPGTPTMAPGFAQSFDLVDLAEVQEWRALFTGGSTAAYIGAMSWGKQNAGGARVPRLEIAPEIIAGQKSAFTLSYRSRWVRVSDATREIDLFSWCIPAFKEALRCFARGYHEEDVATVSDRLAKLVAGPVYEQAIDQDAMLPDTWGLIKGGAVKTSASRGPFNNFEIQDPS